MLESPYILIVEDNPRHLRLIHDTLEDKKYHVKDATNVEDALKGIVDLCQDKHPPRIVLIDVAIPLTPSATVSKDGGLVLLKKIHDLCKQENIDIHMILVTVWGAEHRVIKTAEEYDVKVISKPLDMKLLLTTIMESLSVGSKRIT
ncbi:MAG: response regulator [Chloroflexota bacterium]